VGEVFEGVREGTQRKENTMIAIREAHRKIVVEWLLNDWNVIAGGEPTGCTIRSILKPGPAMENALAALVANATEHTETAEAVIKAIADNIAAEPAMKSCIKLLVREYEQQYVNGAMHQLGEDNLEALAAHVARGLMK
jgi:hypothetical protein